MSNFQQFVDWLTAWLKGIRDMLDPVMAINAAAEWIAASLPAPSPGMAEVAGQVSSGIAVIAQYIGFLDYVVNLPFLFVVLGVMLAVESGLLVVRAWRLVRSFLT